ncbi:MAG: biotin synthase BioB [Candidatus Omnitrophota bacterium]
MNEFILKLTNKAIEKQGIDRNEARELYGDGGIRLSDILWGADKIRRHFKGNAVELCSIINAKSGSCSEDCKFCAQSSRHRTDIKRYPLLSADEIFEAAKEARKNRAACFGIVTSGKGITSEDELRVICAAARKIKAGIPGLKVSASIGVVSKERLLALKDAGLDIFHHNLETSERYFPDICTTHSYKERIDTILSAQSAGLKLCSGGIFGLGEGPSDRIDLAFTIKELGIKSVPP